MNLLPNSFALALALDMPPCTANSNWTCRLPGILHALYVVAAVLGVVLLVVVVVAVRAWRKNRDLGLPR